MFVFHLLNRDVRNGLPSQRRLSEGYIFRKNPVKYAFSSGLKSATASFVIALLVAAAGTAGASSIDLLTLARQVLFGSTSAPKGVMARASARVSTVVTPRDTVWFDDAIPAGAVGAGSSEAWDWVPVNPAPLSGTLAHQSAAVSGMHQHYFYGASTPLVPAVGDSLFVYVYLDPANPPSEVMVQWNDGSWEHRAYWGANNIDWGTDGTASRRSMGDLPPTGQWVRLEVPASQVGLEGRPINGMAFTLYGGRAIWDAAGKAEQVFIAGTVTIGAVGLAGVAVDAGAGTSCASTDSNGNYACSVPSGFTGAITPTLSGYAFSPPTRAFSNLLAGVSGQDFVAAQAAGNEVVWMEDSVPLGATQASAGEAWVWTASNPTPYSGALAHTSAAVSGIHQHHFYGATNTLVPAAAESLYAYVYLDPNNPPTEVMLQWNDGNWDHRAYWGSNQIDWGTNGSASRRYIGPLPATGAWVRLEVPASLVGLEGRSINGMAFTLFGGRAVWDRAGKLSGSPTTYRLGGQISVNGAPLSGAALLATNGGSCTSTDTSGHYSCTVSANWSGTVSPILAGYSFAPTSRNYSNVAADQTGQGFSAAVLSNQIDGTITVNGAPLAGVSFAASGSASCSPTDSTGRYTCSAPFNWSGSITPTLVGYTFAPASRVFSSVVAAQTAQDYSGSGVSTADVVWVEDSAPAGSSLSGLAESWAWNSSSPAPFSGALAHSSAIVAGLHQHYFSGASTTLTVNADDTLFTYVYLDPINTPTQVMLQWNDGSWEHRAYWGSNQIPWGTDGTNSRRYMGALPASGGWVRLDVPAAQVGLEGRTLSGMAFTLYGGRAFWDRAGKYGGGSSNYGLSGRVLSNGVALSGVTMQPTLGAACSSTDAQGQYSCTVPAGWTGSITPSLAGYSFLPAARSFTGVAANLTAQDFSASTLTYQIDGAIAAGSTPVAGVVMSGSTGSTCSVSDALGRYVCTVPSGWSGTITPTRAGYAFTPVLRNYMAVAANVSSQTFAAAALVQLGGNVAVGASPLSGVSVTATNGGTCTPTDSSGNYSCSVPSGWTGTVTPAMAGYVFSPTSRNYSTVIATQTNQSYVAFSAGAGAPTLVGATSAPADGGAVTGPLTTISPPPGMAAGDLVVLVVHAPLVSTYDPLIDSKGGQEWSAYDATFPSNFSTGVRIFWARYSGTWSEVLSVRSPGWTTGGQPITLQMLVYRASDPQKWWVPDVWGYRSPGFTAPGSPGIVSIPGITTLSPQTVSLAVLASPGSVAWTNMSGAGWSNTGLPAQVRNSAGSGLTLTTAYQLRSTEAPTGNLTMQQVGGATEGAYYMISFAAIDLPSGGVTAPVARVQNKARQIGGVQTLSVTFDQPVGSGNMVIGYVYFETAATRIKGPITDDQGNEYTVIQAVDTTTVTQIGVLFFRPNITNSPRTINVTVEGGNAIFSGIMAHEVRGKFALDQYTGDWLPSGDGFSPGVISTRTVTTTSNGEYIFCVASTPASGPAPPYYDFSAWASSRVVSEIRTTDSSGTLASADAVQTVAGPIACTASVPFGTQHFLLMATFKPIP